MSPRELLTHGVAAIALLGGCSAAPAAAPAAPPPAAAVTPAPPPAPKASASSAAPAGPAACGELQCKLFDTPEQAFLAVLEQQPRVLAIGEAHAQKGSEVPSSTARFTGSFLPLLSGRATDLILELMVPNPQCKKAVVKEVAKRQKPVTEPQAESNQNEFLVLARRAQELKVAPHVLRPSCADFDEITKAGDNDVAAMLAMIARLTTALAKPLIERNGPEANGKLVVAYGGALHNDLAPRAGREAFSFGPELQTHTGGRYVELDLIVPEFIKDSETWRALPWYQYFDPQRAPGKTTLYNPSPGSYVLIFARSS